MTYLKSLLVVSAATVLASPALAQVPSPTASYAGTMQIVSDGQVLNAKVNAAPYKHRMEVMAEGQTMVSIIDYYRNQAYSYPLEGTGEMANMAMKVNFDTAMASMGGHVDSKETATKIGQDVVAGQVCDLYQQEEAIGCITADGVMMRVTGLNNRMEMKTMTRGAQPAELFTIPEGYRVVDMTQTIGALGDVAAYQNGTYDPEAASGDDFMTNLVANQAEKRVKKEIRNQMGRSVGGAIGGSLVGGAVGNEAGKLVKGLFGKKKKKKKKEPEAETPE